MRATCRVVLLRHLVWLPSVQSTVFWAVSGLCSSHLLMMLSPATCENARENGPHGWHDRQTTHLVRHLVFARMPLSMVLSDLSFAAGVSSPPLLFFISSVQLRWNLH